MLCEKGYKYAKNVYLIFVISGFYMRFCERVYVFCITLLCLVTKDAIIYDGISKDYIMQ